MKMIAKHKDNAAPTEVALTKPAPVANPATNSTKAANAIPFKKASLQPQRTRVRFFGAVTGGNSGGVFLLVASVDLVASAASSAKVVPVTD